MSYTTSQGYGPYSVTTTTPGQSQGASQMAAAAQQQSAAAQAALGPNQYYAADGTIQTTPYGSADPYGYMASQAASYPLAPTSTNYGQWQQTVQQETGQLPTTTALDSTSPNYNQVSSLGSQGVSVPGAVGSTSYTPTGSSSSNSTSGATGTGSYNNPITAGVVSPPGQIGNTVGGVQVPNVPLTAAQAMSLASQQNGLEGQLNQANNVNLNLSASQQLANLMNQAQSAQQNQGIQNTELAAGQYGNSLQQALQNAQLQSQLWQSNVGLQNQSLQQDSYLAPMLQNLFSGTGTT